MAREDLTPYAVAGFSGSPNPHIYSSSCWYAHEVGAWFQHTGRPMPSDVRMSRGCQVRVRDMIFRHKENTTPVGIVHSWTREQ